MLKAQTDADTKWGGGEDKDGCGKESAAAAFVLILLVITAVFVLRRRDHR